MEQEIKSTVFALCSISDYLRLNERISTAMGYDLSKDTARENPVTPRLHKVNQKWDKNGNEISYETMAVIQISVQVQELLPDILTGLTPINHWEIIDAPLATELTAEGLSTEAIDFTLEHSAVCDTPFEVMILESAPRTSESDWAVEKLVNEGKTIITMSDEA